MEIDIVTGVAGVVHSTIERKVSSKIAIQGISKKGDNYVSYHSCQPVKTF